MFFVYVLRERTTGKLYIGSSENINRRMEEHQRNKPGYVLAYKEARTTKLDALKREHYLKSGNGRRTLELILAEQKQNRLRA